MGGEGVGEQPRSLACPYMDTCWIHQSLAWASQRGVVKDHKKNIFLIPFPKSLVCHIMSLCSLGPQLVHTWIHQSLAWASHCAAMSLPKYSLYQHIFILAPEQYLRRAALNGNNKKILIGLLVNEEVKNDFYQKALRLKVCILSIRGMLMIISCAGI